MSGRLEVVAPDGVPEVARGDDLADLLLAALRAESVDLADGDIVVVTSKVISKSEGRVVPGSDREVALPAETVRIVARRGSTAIVRTRHGLTMAAAGIDASNVAVGSLVLLPVDPDASARRLRARLRARTGRTLGVIVTDTAGRAWREGQTDIAVGAAGILVAEDFAGRTDHHGNPLLVTAPAVADEVAGAAELAQGKLGRRPFAVVRGRADLVLDPDDEGPGARSLVRPEGGDLFGFGAREAVLRALIGLPADRLPFGSPAVATELARAFDELSGLTAVASYDDQVQVSGGGGPRGPDPRIAPLAFAFGWAVDDAAPGDAVVTLRPTGP